MRWAAFISIILMLGKVAGGQTTQGSSSDAVPPAWERLVSSLAAAAAAHDPQAVQALVPAGCVVHRFNAQRDTDSSALVDFTSANSVLGDHAYLYPSPTFAEDIARDVNSTALVSDFIKKTLALGSKQDQAVAMQWLTQTLGAEDGMPIAIIVLWNAGPDQDDRHRPIFILIKGEKDGDGFKFSQIVYGDPLQ